MENAETLTHTHAMNQRTFTNLYLKNHLIQLLRDRGQDRVSKPVQLIEASKATTRRQTHKALFEVCHVKMLVTIHNEHESPY
jgi:hypothetical protein